MPASPDPSSLPPPPSLSAQPPLASAAVAPRPERLLARLHGLLAEGYGLPPRFRRLAGPRLGQPPEADAVDAGLAVASLPGPVVGRLLSALHFRLSGRRFGCDPEAAFRLDRADLLSRLAEAGFAPLDGDPT